MPDVDELAAQLSNWTSVLNEQANRLMTETNRRSTTQQTLAAGNLTLTAAIGAAVISGKADVLVLMLLPLTSVCLGAQYKDHHEAIGRVGIYVRECVEEALQVVVLDRKVPTAFMFWQDFRQRLGAKKIRLAAGEPQEWRKTWRTAVVANFHGTAVMALGLTFASAIYRPVMRSIEQNSVRFVDVWPSVLWLLLLALTCMTAVSMHKSLRQVWDTIEELHQDGTWVVLETRPASKEHVVKEVVAASPGQPSAGNTT